MKSHFSLLLFLALAGCTATVTVEAPSDADVIATLTRQSDEWDKAIVRHDSAAISHNMAADFRQIRGDGAVIDRETFLRGILSPDLTIDPYIVEEFTVRLYGDVALLSGRTRMTGREDGAAFVSHYRYIDIYVKRDGVWKVASVQVTRIPDAPLPGESASE